jgi:eukaryotic-like serine/threonine-protein kinase
MLHAIVRSVAQRDRSGRTARAPWSRGASDAESRAFLQERLTLLFKLLFWCFVALMAFVWVAYQQYPEVRPQHQRLVYLAFAIGLAMQGAIWRGLLVRRTLSFKTLHGIDASFAIIGNTIIAACAVIAFDQRQSAYTCLIYTCWMVLTRALIVPSTGTRTAIVTAVSMLPMGIAGVILARIATWPGPKDVPPLGLLVGYAQIAAVAVLLSASGSRIIYGLRQKISAVQQLGQYKLVQKIGEGGNGTVYLAHHVLLRRPTAIKLLPPSKVGHDNLVRFEREVQHMSQLTHPNTVAVFDYGHSPDGVFYYAMEYLGGGIDLEQLVTSHGPQPAERVRQILVQVCGALQEAHDSGFIHRDIKPANIILCERGGMSDVAKVVDFGLVKEITAETADSTQVILGTPAYIAPEAVTDPGNIGAGVDIYALGATAYFLLAGRRVFTGKTAVDLCVQHVSRLPDPLSQVGGVAIPPALETVVMRCLAKQPAERFSTAHELAAALQAIGPLADWDEGRAEAWWRAYRPKTPMPDVSGVATVTMAVDVQHRDEAA